MKVCKMMFDMTGVTRQYVDMEVDFDGVEYTGPSLLLEYTVSGERTTCIYWCILEGTK